MGVIATLEGSNDRTWLEEQRANRQQEQRQQDELRHYESMGAGLAVMCLSFWHVLHENDTVQPAVERFSRDEKLQLLVAAMQGR